MGNAHSKFVVVAIHEIKQVAAFKLAHIDRLIDREATIIIIDPSAGIPDIL
jgi:hypothetical protein